MATEEQWKHYTSGLWEGKPSGNALHAQAVRQVPLEAQAILDLVLENLEYYGDSYYDALTVPVDMRVAEYYESIGRKVPQ